MQKLLTSGSDRSISHGISLSEHYRADGNDESRSQLQKVRIDPGQTKTVELTIGNLDLESPYTLYLNGDHQGVIQPDPPLHERLDELKPLVAKLLLVFGVTGMFGTVLVSGLVIIKERRGRDPNLRTEQLDWAGKVSISLFFIGILTAVLSLSTLALVP